jgi:hypothetical protein
VRKFTSIASVLVLSALIASCTDQPTATEGPTLDAPSLNFMNNPDNGNPKVWRYEDGAFLLIFDSDSPLVAVHTTFPNCGGELQPVSVQEIVDNPNDPFSDQVRQLLQADDINIYIVDLSASGACFGFGLVASGTGNLVNTDNDFWAFLHDNPNANAFGFTAQGSLTSPGGAGVRYSGVSKCVWDGDDQESIKCKDKINLR